MKKLGKKLMSLAMVGTLVAAPVSVSATPVTDVDNLTGGTVEGSASVEAAIATTIYDVDVPTAEAAQATLKMTLDPQQLIYQSVQAGVPKTNYENKTIDPTATVLFANSDTEGVTGYSAISDKLKIVNKSSEPIAVTLTPTYTGTAFALTDKADFSSGGTDVEIYLGISTQGEDAVAITGADLDPINLEGAPAGAYQVVYENSSYVKELKDDVSGYNFDTLEFQVTGAINTDTTVDWTTMTSATAGLEIAYAFDAGSQPTGDLATFDGTTTAATITLTGSGTVDRVFASFDSLTATLSDGTQSANLLDANGTTWTAATISDANKDGTNDKIVLSSKAKSFLSTNTSDPTNITGTLTYTTDKGKTRTTTVTFKVK